MRGTEQPPSASRTRTGEGGARAICRRARLSDAQLTDGLAPDVAVVLGPLLGDPIAVGDAVTALRRYSLVALAGDGMVLVHRLVQAITLDLESTELVSRWEHAAAALAEAALPHDPRQPGTWPAFAALLPIAERMLGPEHRLALQCGVTTTS